MFTLAEFAVKALQITGGHVLADSIFGVPLDRVQQGFGLAIGLRLRRGIEPVDGQALSATPGTRGRTRGRTQDRLKDGLAVWFCGLSFECSEQFVPLWCLYT